MLHICLVQIFEKEPERVIIECEEDVKYPTENEDNLIFQVCKAFSPNLPLGFHIKVKNEIPMGRGLGSSGAAIVGGILLAILLDSINSTESSSNNHCCTVSFNEILRVAYQFENHFDNIGPSLTGGLVSAFSSASHQNFRLNCFQISKAFQTHIQAFALIPQNTQTATKEARGIVSRSLPLDRHIDSMQKAFTLVSLISHDDDDDEDEEFEGSEFVSHMQSCLWENFVHMRQRVDLIQENGWEALKVMDRVLQDSNVGYLGTTISGSGPTILLFQASY